MSITLNLGYFLIKVLICILKKECLNVLDVAVSEAFCFI